MERRQRWEGWGVALLAALLFLPGMASRDLWNPDEPRYAVVAREMLESGQYFVPHLNGELYSQKPPLLFWLMAASSPFVGGMNETAARLPSGLAAVAAVTLTFLIGRRLFGRRAAGLAAASFATGIKLMWQGRVGQIDMLLVALVTFAVWWWLRSETEGRPGLGRLFFVTAGLATVAKGPVGLLPPLLSILAWVGLLRDRAALRRLKVGRGLLLWAGVVLLWLAPAGLIAGREYLEPILFKQNLQRYADPWHHHQPWYYYLTVVPADFFPWSFLLPSALVIGWRRLVGSLRGLRARLAAGTEEGWAGRGFLFAVCWVVVTILFFSLSPAKRTVYVLTMFPGLALVVGAGLDRLLAALDACPAGSAERRALRRWLLAPLIPLAALLTALAAAPLWLESELAAGGPQAERWLKKVPELPHLPADLPQTVALWLSLAALGAWLAVWLAGRRRGGLGLGLLAGGMAASGLGLILGVLPLLNPWKSARPVVDEFLARSTAEEPYAVYPRLDAPVLFYTKRFAEWPKSPEELRTWATGPGPRWLFIEHDDLDALPFELPMTEVARGADLRDGYVLMSKKVEVPAAP
ncbi:MAG TPA: glycosyltransferase family 39 protein [Thermoanaerobaculia bacterium]|nr:glycosyltransferase family 39 protein [Thermoanaerobaculia bacterium]